MQWISIEDKLPEPYECVLVTDGKVVESCTFINGFGTWFHDLDKIDEDNITHWAIFPELPNKD